MLDQIFRSSNAELAPSNPESINPDVKPVTDESAARWEDVVMSDLRGQTALVGALLDGKPVTIVALVGERPDGLTNVQPVYIEVNEDLFYRLTPPLPNADPANEA